jgi:uncharacterized repeat protein (TIGR01451 family)
VPVNQCVDITKDPDIQRVPVGQPATFTITVRNCGGVELNNLVVSDPLVADCDNHTVGTLAPGAEHSYTCSTTVTTSFTNTATVTGTNPNVQDSDTAEVVAVPSACIEIAKDPDSQIVPENGSATFTITVTNCGIETLTNVRVTDALVADCDNPALGTLPPADSRTYSCTASNVASSFTNVAVAAGEDEGGDTVEDSDTAEVTVSAGTLSISKDPDVQQVQQGDWAAFTITVRNTGNVDLTNVTVTDPLAPECVWGPEDLAVGEQHSFDCSVQADADFVNEAHADGVDPLGIPVPRASDTALVDVIHPSILIEKSPDEQAVVNGGTAEFTITVTNTGDADLTNVTVSDPRAPLCDQELGTLAAGQSTDYTCSATATGWTVNVASVVGTPPAGANVTSSDEASILYVEEPCPPTEKKRANPPERLVLQYTGFEAEVRIRVEHPKDGQLFSGIVPDGGLFEVYRKRGLNPEIVVSIYSTNPEDPQLIDQVTIHTSCSQPLYIGQVFGTNPAAAAITVKGMPQ